jgi:hypothetical protein
MVKKYFYKFLPFGELVLATNKWDTTTSATYGKLEQNMRRPSKACAGSLLSKNHVLPQMPKRTLTEEL